MPSFCFGIGIHRTLENRIGFGYHPAITWLPMRITACGDPGFTTRALDL